MVLSSSSNLLHIPVEGLLLERLRKAPGSEFRIWHRSTWLPFPGRPLT